MALLVRTPRPHQNESLLGYVLRASEANGYETPWHVFQLAGIAQGEMRSPSLPTEKIAAVLNLEASDLTTIAYVSKEKAQSFKLLAHSLGRSPKHHFLSLKHPKICPQCIQENGYVDAFWDLDAAVACPAHRSEPISRCPKCGDGISWFRPGLLHCGCGADFSEATPTATDTTTAELMGLVKAKLEGAPLRECSNTSGFPVAQLDHIPLHPFLRLLSTLGACCSPRPEGTSPDLADSLVTAGKVLSDWPRGYHHALSEVGQQLMSEGLTSVGLRSQFKSLYTRLFVRKAFKGYAQFLKDEFITFGMQHWGAAAIDAKFGVPAALVEQARYVSKQQYARRYGLSAPKLTEMIAAGIVAATAVVVGNSRRVVVDLENTELPAESEGIVTVREAARRLGLPVSVLKYLRGCGVFNAKPRAGHTESWHLDDVEAFLAASLDLAAIDEPEVETVALEEVMRLKFRDPTAKGELAVALFNRRLRVLGRISDNLAGLLLDKREVTAFVERLRQTINGETCSVASAATETGLQQMAIKSAARLGFLEAKTTDGRTRITMDSIARFNSSYLALSRIAKDLGSTTSRLVRFCDSTGVPVSEIPCENGSAPSRVIPKNLLEMLLNSWKSACASRRTVTPPPREAHEAAMSRYLNELKARSEQLPRRAGAPNKAVIARACGFHRDVLYDQQNVIDLLEAQDRHERERLTVLR